MSGYHFPFVRSGSRAPRAVGHCGSSGTEQLSRVRVGVARLAVNLSLQPGKLVWGRTPKMETSGQVRASFSRNLNFGNAKWQTVYDADLVFVMAVHRGRGIASARTANRATSGPPLQTYS
jgi:hypothetical protein